MNVLKMIGWVTMGGLLLAGSIGGALWWQFRQRRTAPSPVPSNPPRKAEPTDEPPTTDARPTKNQPHCHTLRRDEVSPELVADFDAMFSADWPTSTTDEVIDKLQPGEAILFVVESEQTEDFDLPRQEIITAKVLSVGRSEVHGRVIAPIAHADHHGNHAGHGLHVGSRVEVPRSHVLAAARLGHDPERPASGYGSQGEPARVFEPSKRGQVFTVHPSTVYELDLPYRTETLKWTQSRDDVKYSQIGDHRLRHQIKFTEASVRGPYSLTLFDEDQREGTVFVGRWDFVIAE